MNEWQPIESAPNDGTKIIVGRERNGKIRKSNSTCAWMDGDHWFGEYNGVRWPLPFLPSHWSKMAN